MPTMLAEAPLILWAMAVTGCFLTKKGDNYLEKHCGSESTFSLVITGRDTQHFVDGAEV